MKIKRGDQVVVISGKESGKKGKVLACFPKEERVVVQGVNLVKKHTRPTRNTPQGGIIEVEGKLTLANVMLVCPKCGKPARTGTHIDKDGSKRRVCRKCETKL